MIRIIIEHDEDERPTSIIHGVRLATTKKIVDADAGSQYLAMCGEILYSPSKRLGRKQGIPTCLRCTVAMLEEAACFP